MSSHKRLGNQIKISMKTDERGYIGRECPNSECEGYFKVRLGTGLQGVTDCYCPYCGYKGNQNEFFTKDQIEYIKSIGMQKVTDALKTELKKLEFDHKPKGSLGIGISMRFEPGRPYPIHRYREKDLETYIICSNCTLQYAVYGVFAFCPDCGEPNTLQIFHENLKVIHKIIEIAGSTEPIIAQNLIENAFEDCVSSFDGFGRELCNINSANSNIPDRVHKISFQSLDGAKENIKTHFGFDLDKGVSNEEWNIANISFQKRHLLAHKMGIIDDEYVRRSGDTKAIIGRKVVISLEDVLNLIPIIEKLAGFMIDSINKARKS